MSVVTPVGDFDVILAMQRFGGSFVQALAAAFRAADPINTARLKAAFPDYWTEYTVWAVRVKEREAAK